jgi:hypothetical protein
VDVDSAHACPACGALNGASGSVCLACGANLERAAEALPRLRDAQRERAEARADQELRGAIGRTRRELALERRRLLLRLAILGGCLAALVAAAAGAAAHVGWL